MHRIHDTGSHTLHNHYTLTVFTNKSVACRLCLHVIARCAEHRVASASPPPAAVEATFNLVRHP